MNTSFNKQIAEDAAAWAVALDDGPLEHDQKQALLDWLKTSPVHLDEFLLALSILEGSALTPRSARLNTDDLLQQISGDVLAFKGSAAALQAEPTPSSRLKLSPKRYGILAAGVIGLCATIISLALQKNTVDPQPDAAMLIRTALGEQRSVPLPDGSIIVINTQSQLKIGYTDTVREIEIYTGEALFDVAKDPVRPFRVIAGPSVAEAVGTRFNVRHINDKIDVAVIEGIVAFAPKNSRFDDIVRVAGAGDDRSLEQGKVILNAGERTNMSATTKIPIIAGISTDAVTAWTARRLVFSGDDLSTIVAEFNRYNIRKLVISDDSLAKERLSGVFAADDPSSLIDFLKLTRGMRTAQSDHELGIRLE
ncbi:MAG: FecR domain-containing protein [Pseudomonadota bacterium]